MLRAPDGGQARGDDGPVMNKDDRTHERQWRWEDGFGVFNDDAFLHFEPDLDSRSVAGPSRLLLERRAMSNSAEEEFKDHEDEEDEDSLLPLAGSLFATTGARSKDKAKATKRAKVSGSRMRSVSSPLKRPASQVSAPLPLFADDSLDHPLLSQSVVMADAATKRRKRRGSDDSISSPTKSKTPASPAKKPRSKQKSGPSFNPTDLPLDPKPRSRRKRPAAATSDASDSGVSGSTDTEGDLKAALEEKLKTSIFTDEELHLRILRYEPIHLDVFLEMIAGVKMRKDERVKIIKGILDKLVSYS